MVWSHVLFCFFFPGMCLSNLASYCVLRAIFFNISFVLRLTKSILVIMGSLSTRANNFSFSSSLDLDVAAS